MDTHFLKITGKMNIPKELEVDKSYTIALDWACTDTTKRVTKMERIPLYILSSESTVW